MYLTKQISAIVKIRASLLDIPHTNDVPSGDYTYVLHSQTLGNPTGNPMTTPPSALWLTGLTDPTGFKPPVMIHGQLNEDGVRLAAVKETDYLSDPLKVIEALIGPYFPWKTNVDIGNAITVTLLTTGLSEAGTPMAEPPKFRHDIGSPPMDYGHVPPGFNGMPPAHGMSPWGPSMDGDFRRDHGFNRGRPYPIQPGEIDQRLAQMFGMVERATRDMSIFQKDILEGFRQQKLELEKTVQSLQEEISHIQKTTS